MSARDDFPWSAVTPCSPRYLEMCDEIDSLRSWRAAAKPILLEFKHRFGGDTLLDILLDDLTPTTYPIPHEFVQTDGDSYCDICGGSNNGAGVHNMSLKPPNPFRRG